MKLATVLALVLASASVLAQTSQSRVETGFLDRTVRFDGRTVRYQVPADTADRAWPVMPICTWRAARHRTDSNTPADCRADPLADRFFGYRRTGRSRTSVLDPDMQEMAVRARSDHSEFRVDPDRVSERLMGATGAGVSLARPVCCHGDDCGPRGVHLNFRRRGGASCHRFLADPFAEPPSTSFADLIFQGGADEGIPVDNHGVFATLKRRISVRYTEYPGTHDDSVRRRWPIRQR